MAVHVIDHQWVGRAYNCTVDIKETPASYLMTALTRNFETAGVAIRDGELIPQRHAWG